MSCWYYSPDELEHKTPSRDDGVPLCVENRYRRDGARFIISASNTLGLRYETPATGVVFFHRFFMIQSFKQFNRWVVAAACLLLAGKVEETPKKCKDVLKVTQSILTEQQMANFSSNPKEELLTHERILLQTIKFDLQVEHPYSYLLKIAKSLKGDKQKMEKLVQTAWTFVNDSLSTVLCLQWEPQAIAVAFLYLAGKLAKYDLQSITQSKSRSWWRVFVDTLDVHDLDTICHQVLDTYGEAADSSSTSQDEDDDLQSFTPHQTPPSTASIPPSLSVTQSGGVAHTTSAHMSVPTVQSQLLTQQLPLPTRQQQLAASPQLPLSSLQAMVGGVAASGVALPPQPPGPPLPPLPSGTLNYTAFHHQQQSAMHTGVVQPSPATTPLPQPPPPAVAAAPGYSTLSTVQQLTHLQQQQQVLQAMQRGLTAVRTGGPEITPPPAKRHAMETSYHPPPGVPQHQLLSSFASQTSGYAAQQLGTPPTSVSHLFPSPRSLQPLPSSLPVSAGQLRPMVPPSGMPGLPGGGGAGLGYRAATPPGDIRRTMGWQPK